jgi:hypothetical protein
MLGVVGVEKNGVVVLLFSAGGRGIKTQYRFINWIRNLYDFSIQMTLYDYFYPKYFFSNWYFLKLRNQMLSICDANQLFQ